MSGTAISALAAIFMVVLLAVLTVVIVVGGGTLVWSMVTDLIDAIREREEEET